MSGIREVCFDTETTGFHAKGEDRITELGCIELIDMIPTGNQYHAYLNPQRDVPEKVTQITGLTTDFLKNNGQLFADVATEFLEFVGDSKLIAHNANFDKAFINAELEKSGHPIFSNDRFIDTLQMAREKFPGSPASLDALCKRYGISLSSRDKHGAIIDSELLAEVYLQLKGGRMRNLDLKNSTHQTPKPIIHNETRERPLPLSSNLTTEQIKSHRLYIKSLGEKMVWNKYWR